MDIKDKILVIIPAYNEESAIGGVIDEIKKYLPFVDILVVNDGSKDSTSVIVRKKNVFVIDLPFNLGVGVAMQTGYQFAQQFDYDLSIKIDADGQHSPEEAVKLINPILDNEADVVVGSRFLGEGAYRSSFYRRIGIRFFSGIISFLIGQKITDPTSGFRAVNKKVIKFHSCRYSTDYPEVEEFIHLNREGFKISEVGILMCTRKGGKTSITPRMAAYYMIKVTLTILFDLITKKILNKKDIGRRI